MFLALPRDGLLLTTELTLVFTVNFTRSCSFTASAMVISSMPSGCGQKQICDEQRSEKWVVDVLVLNLGSQHNTASDVGQARLQQILQVQSWLGTYWPHVP
jgi:hypothetical protein